jgi:thymidylate synthase ThyX
MMGGMRNLALLSLLFGLACGSRTAKELDLKTQEQTEAKVEGGGSFLEASLSLRSPEALAIQDVPYDQDPKSWQHLQDSVRHYRKQWTFTLVVGPKPGANVDPRNPLALDIENNGGAWRDHGRNLRRLMFEMRDYVRLVLPDGTETHPPFKVKVREFGQGMGTLEFPVTTRPRELDDSVIKKMWCKS